MKLIPLKLDSILFHSYCQLSKSFQEDISKYVISFPFDKQLPNLLYIVLIFIGLFRKHYDERFYSRDEMSNKESCLLFNYPIHEFHHIYFKFVSVMIRIHKIIHYFHNLNLMLLPIDNTVAADFHNFL